MSDELELVECKPDPRWAEYERYLRLVERQLWRTFGFLPPEDRDDG